MIEITGREFYNILVEEKFTGGACATTEGDDYVELDIPTGLKWPLFDTLKSKFVKSRPETIKINCFSKEKKNIESDSSPDWLQFNQSFDSFISKFPPIFNRIDLPAAVTEQIFLGSKSHVSIQNIKDLRIKIIISGE